MPDADDLDRRISALAALDQPLRRDLYRLLSDEGAWVTRDQAAAALSIPRSVAAFHLDKLAEAGVVEITFQRTTGRSGPGAGRPAKLYRRAHAEVAASVPERRYDLAASLLATAVAEADRTGAPVSECVSTTARAAGRAIGEQLTVDGPLARREDRRRALVDLLAQYGYEPVVGARGEVALANCPFHRLAEEHRALVCGMNLELVTGVLEAMGSRNGLHARLAPEPGYCCVRIGAARASADQAPATSARAE